MPRTTPGDAAHGAGRDPDGCSDRELLERDVEAYLDRYQNKSLLRFVVVGSVDDGKSTLIGRLLHDTGMLYEDQVEAVRRASQQTDQAIDFSLFTDGLKAEREQGITIDVAYRYFSTEKRKFILADTPGHLQYTRNMVTGASTADVAIILIDARLGVLEQSRRHAAVTSLLSIPHLAVCVNKMDLVGYDEAVYARIQEEFRSDIAKLAFREVTFFPVSALRGINIVTRSTDVPWYQGPSVLEYLEGTEPWRQSGHAPLRFPVQSVLRPHLDYRGFAGTLARGNARRGDSVLLLPSGKKTRIKGIDIEGTEVTEASAGQAVVFRLEDEVDVSRGDMLVAAAAPPRVARTFEANVVWMGERPLDLEKTYLIKHTTQMVRVQIAEVLSRLAMDSLEPTYPQAGDTLALGLNDIGRVRVKAHRALFFDGYRDCRVTGSFIVIDSLTNNTVAAGMIEGAERVGQSFDELVAELRAGSGLEPKSQVSPTERRERLGQEGRTVWLTGLPGSGRWSLAYALERRLFDLGHTATVVIPTAQDLTSMIASACACTDAGLVTICAFPSFRRADRRQVRDRLGKALIEVYVNTNETLCRQRRPNASFEGFEAPDQPDVTVALDHSSLDEAIAAILVALRA